MKKNTDYIEKQSIQAGQYQTAYHWSDEKRVEAYRYKKMTEYFVAILAEYANSLNSREITILDFGCGDGYGAYLTGLLLGERGVKANVYGVDVEETAIQWATQLTGETSSFLLQFCVGDIQKGVDLVKANKGPVVVIMREVIEHLPEADIDEILQYINTTLPEAKLMISVPSTNSPTEEKHFRHYTADLLESTLRQNNYLPTLVTGFGFRPAVLYWLLKRAKAKLNKGSRFWWLLNPCWQSIKAKWAITLVVVAKNSQDSV